MKKDVTTMRLEPDDLAEARKLAHQEGLDVADILRRWIRLGRKAEKEGKK